MSLAQLLAGQKRDSPVWDYFAYESALTNQFAKLLAPLSAAVMRN